MNRSDILALAPATYRVQTMRWGDVDCRHLTGLDAERFLAIMELPAGPERLAALVVLAAVDPAFEEVDIPRLARGHLEPLNEIASAVLTDAGVGEKKSSASGSAPPIALPTSLSSRIPIG